MQGQVQGYANASPYIENTPQKPQRFDGPASQLEEMLKGMADYNARLSRIADRLGGTAPPTGVEKDGARIAASGIVSRFENIADSYASALRTMNNAIDRLESL